MHRMRRAENEFCRHNGEVDLLDHTVLAFEKWKKIQRSCIQELRALTPENIVQKMLESLANW